jgi:hypothetical protein
MTAPTEFRVHARHEQCAPPSQLIQPRAESASARAWPLHRVDSGSGGHRSRLQLCRENG